MWNYVYYRAYLEYKERTEYNGNESYIADKLSKFDISWIPVKKSSILIYYIKLIFLNRTLGIENEENEEKKKHMLIKELDEKVFANI